MVERVVLKNFIHVLHTFEHCILYVRTNVQIFKFTINCYLNPPIIALSLHNRSLKSMNHLFIS